MAVNQMSAGHLEESNAGAWRQLQQVGTDREIMVWLWEEMGGEQDDDSSGFGGRIFLSLSLSFYFLPSFYHPLGLSRAQPEESLSLARVGQYKVFHLRAAGRQSPADFWLMSR